MLFIFLVFNSKTSLLCLLALDLTLFLLYRIEKHVQNRKLIKMQIFQHIYSILLYTSLAFFSAVNKFCESVSYFNTCLCCLLSRLLSIIAAVVVVVHIDDCRSPMPNRTHFPKQEA